MIREKFSSAPQKEVLETMLNGSRHIIRDHSRKQGGSVGRQVNIRETRLALARMLTLAERQPSPGKSKDSQIP